jgi:hypothetical protein
MVKKALMPAATTATRARHEGAACIGRWAAADEAAPGALDGVVDMRDAGARGARRECEEEISSIVPCIPYGKSIFHLL